MLRDPNPDEPAETRPDGERTTPIIISVCVTCKHPDANNPARPGVALFDAVQQATMDDGANVRVRRVQCLGVCKRPATAAVSGHDRYTFVFGDLNAEGGADALATFARSYRRAPYGLVPWRERPEAIRRGLVARIPPAIWSPDDGQPPA